MRERSDDMPKKPLTDKSGVVPELTREHLRGFRPAAEVLPPDLLAVLPRRRGRRRRPSRSSDLEALPRGARALPRHGPWMAALRGRGALVRRWCVRVCHGTRVRNHLRLGVPYSSGSHPKPGRGRNEGPLPAPARTTQSRTYWMNWPAHPSCGTPSQPHLLRAPAWSSIPAEGACAYPGH